MKMLNVDAPATIRAAQNRVARGARTAGTLWALLTAVASVPGCITSPTGAALAAQEAQEVKLDPCPQGMLDDGEDNDGQVVKLEGREGYWFTFADSEGTTVEPKGNFFMTPGGPPGSKYAARMRGTVAAKGKSLYVGMGLALTNPRGSYDAGKYQGVSFWGKGPGRIRFKTPDVNTTPEGDKCSDCYNDFGVDIYFSEEWTRYTVPFEKLKQQSGWGDQAPAVSNNALYAIQWQFGTPDSDYEIWIDNVTFVGCKQ